MWRANRRGQTSGQLKLACGLNVPVGCNSEQWKSIEKPHNNMASQQQAETPYAPCHHESLVIYGIVYMLQLFALFVLSLRGSESPSMTSKGNGKCIGMGNGCGMGGMCGGMGGMGMGGMGGMGNMGNMSNSMGNMGMGKGGMGSMGSMQMGNMGNMGNMPMGNMGMGGVSGMFFNRMTYAI